MIEEVKTVCFLGAGTVGCYNSLTTALAGYEVILYDISEAALKNAPDRQRGWIKKLVELERHTEKEVEEAIKRITPTTDAAASAKNADLLSESVLEQLDLKRKIHREFDQLLPPHAIMTTNTSSLLLSDIESAVERRDKFAAMHFHQPSLLVDIVAGPLTTPDTIDIIKRFILSQGQEYVLLKKERSGYLHNAMLAAILTSATVMTVLLQADIHAVDRSWMLNRNSPKGPFASMDYVGIDLVWDAFVEMSKRESYIKQDLFEAVQAFFKPYIDQGRLGQKSDQGFYSYPEPEYEKPEFTEGKREDENLSNTILNSFLATALSLLADGHAEMEDIDRSWTLIHDKEIGPFVTMDRIGLDVVKENLLARARAFEELLGHPGTIQAETDRAVAVLDTYIKRGEFGEKSGKGFYTHPL